VISVPTWLADGQDGFACSAAPDFVFAAAIAASEQ